MQASILAKFFSEFYAMAADTLLPHTLLAYTTPIILRGQNVLRQEAAALERTAMRLDGTFNEAVQRLLACKGRAVVSGVGKSARHRAEDRGYL